MQYTRTHPNTYASTLTVFANTIDTMYYIQKREDSIHVNTLVDTGWTSQWTSKWTAVKDWVLHNVLATTLCTTLLCKFTSQPCTFTRDKDMAKFTCIIDSIVGNAHTLRSCTSALSLWCNTCHVLWWVVWGWGWGWGWADWREHGWVNQRREREWARCKQECRSAG